jgi:hypothetical protein
MISCKKPIAGSRPRARRSWRLFARLAVAIALIVAGVGLFVPRAQAEDASIFDMRKSLPLEPDEAATREFYVNAGPEAGLRAGMFVRVSRALPVYDPIANKGQATMTVAVGTVKIIHSERGISVARPIAELTDEDRPTLEYEGIMIGDSLDLGSATMEEPKPVKKKTARRTAAASEAAVAIERVRAVVEAAPSLAPPSAQGPLPASSQAPAAGQRTAVGQGAAGGASAAASSAAAPGASVPAAARAQPAAAPATVTRPIPSKSPTASLSTPSPAPLASVEQAREAGASGRSEASAPASSGGGGPEPLAAADGALPSAGRAATASAGEAVLQAKSL